MKFGFRADAALDIGAGHVMRCITLAQALSDRGAECTFICREHPGHLIEAIRTAGFGVTGLPVLERSGTEKSPYASWVGADTAVDASQSRAIFDAQGCNFIIADHYGLDAQWERAVSPAGRIGIIDDLANRPHYSALLIDQTLDRAAHSYAGLVPDDCITLCGSSFAILRPQFAKARARSLELRAGRAPGQILVSMGGIDRDNLTGRVLDVLTALPSDLEFRTTVVLGATAPWREAVTRQAATSRRKVEVLVNVADMAELLIQTDLAIGAAGSSAWERCCLGVPTVMAVTADNQTEIARAVAARGAALTAGAADAPGFDSRLAGAIVQLLRESDLRSGMSHAAAAVTDGLGADRVADALMELIAQ
ncbi:UDP-2,4-diacetamido-2,4,6-trideoxy-beta-L-altropyranose hydrolase [Devosia sp. FKR38]|uniref:UDP-2,4-diacetamido-2,4, 6-trideoxy-beta-L-altropyranose hydrolase n=1 Tax=Devosia sp. FKR38 TaxID=2562312 RepID=UPI0010C0EB16|nr:UDP-2,4-diacetamido-2,4,6-trideoxy-beta-L-altropyranose hydrolase [Devosia sp. FKR38]